MLASIVAQRVGLCPVAFSRLALCRVLLVMKRAAEEELPEGANRARASVCTGARPYYYVCIWCNKYAADVTYKTLWYRYYDAQTGAHIRTVDYIANLCDQCYSQASFPAASVPVQQ